METITKISVEEYLAGELKAEYKSEYNKGEVIAMAGAKYAHNRIVANLIHLISTCLWEKCELFPSDMLLKLPECNKYVYPDIMIVCEEPVLEKNRGLDILLNPVVIIEVLSESTKEYDRGEKMQCYLELESLQEYIMVDSESLNFSSYKKNGGDEWIFSFLKNIEAKANIYDCEIAMKEIYKSVKL